jgi:sporulation-control protein spo0M
VRRLLLTGAQVPEVAGYKAASHRLGDAVAEIEKDIANLLFEADVRQRVVSNTLQVVLSRDDEVRNARHAMLMVKQSPESAACFTLY